MNREVILTAEDIRVNEFSDAGPELADMILHLAERTEPRRRLIYAKGLEHAHTPRWRWFKRRAIDREIHNLLLEFFMEATGPTHKHEHRPDAEDCRICWPDTWPDAPTTPGS